MKVAVLLNRLSEGGAERVGTAWAAGLRSRGHLVDVITTHQTVPSEEHEYIRLDAGSFPVRIWKLAALIKAKDYDIILSLMPHWNVLSLLAVLASGRKAKAVISLHSLEAGMLQTHGLSFAIETALARFLYPTADAVVAVSHAVGAESRARYKIRRGRLWVVPNPALDSVVKAGIGGDRAHAGSLSLVFAGRLVGQKHPDVLIKCASMLMGKRDIAEVRVEFFGSGPLEEKLRLEAERLGVQAIFHGWCEDWTTLCPKNAIFVLPSEVEGFGNVLVEAANIGIPSVTSSRALGVADAVVPGVTGALAAGDQVIDYCDAIMEAHSLPSFDASPWLRRFTSEHAVSILDRIIRGLGSKSNSR